MTAEVLRNYIGGEWIAAETSNLLPVHNPATEELIAQVPLCGAAEIDAAVQSAQTAYESWREVPAAERARYLFELKYLMEKHADEMAAAVTKQMGKPLKYARGEVNTMLSRAEHMASIAPEVLASDVLPAEDGFELMTHHVPHGVVLDIAAWNYPLLIPTKL